MCEKVAKNTSNTWKSAQSENKCAKKSPKSNQMHEQVLKITSNV